MEIYEWCGRHNYSLRQLLMSKYIKALVSDEKDNKIPIELVKLLTTKYNIIDNFASDIYNLKYKILDECGNDMPYFVFIIPSYNNIKYVKKNLESIFKQVYINYRIIYIDDNSIDDTYTLAKELIEYYDMSDRSIIYKSNIRNYQSGSRFIGYHLCDDDEILCMLDGDDWLYSDSVLYTLANTYKKGSMSTYGSYYFYINNKLDNVRKYGDECFPKSVLVSRDFRNYRWTSCHLRTGYAGLFKKINVRDMLLDGYFMRCCTDLCEMYPILEMCSPYIVRIPEVLYVYNRDASQLNSNSYYNIATYPKEKQYRDQVMLKIKQTNKYRNISLENIYENRSKLINKQNYILAKKIENDKNIDTLLYILEICQLNYIGEHLDLDNPILLYNWIKLGTLKDNEFGIRPLIIRKNTKLNKKDLVLSISK